MPTPKVLAGPRLVIRVTWTLSGGTADMDPVEAVGPEILSCLAAPGDIVDCLCTPPAGQRHVLVPI
jgi:hypothetical protein